MNYERGDVVLVPFPFTDLSQQKPRPAIVISISAYQQRTEDVIVVAISSKVPVPLPEGELVLSVDSAGFAQTGLRVSSVVRPGKIVTMHQGLVITRLGQISPDALNKLDQQLSKVLGLQQRRGIWEWRSS